MQGSVSFVPGPANPLDSFFKTNSSPPHLPIADANQLRVKLRLFKIFKGGDIADVNASYQQ